MGIFRQAKLLYEKRTRDQTIQVIQNSGKLELRFGNHIIQSSVSETKPEQLLLEYTQAMMVGFALNPDATNTLQVGLGAGSIAHFIYHHFPKCEQDIVEISPEVIEAAYRHFGIPHSPRLKITEADGAEFVQSSDQRYHLVFQDAFLADGVAEHLQTDEYYKHLGRILSPGGWLVNNVWGSNEAALRVVSQKLGNIFPQLYSISVGVGTNVIFFGSFDRRPVNLRQTLLRAEALSEELSFSLARWVRGLQRVKQIESVGWARPIARI